MRAQPPPAKYARLSVEELDAQTLAELPDDVRRELLAELGSLAPAGGAGGAPGAKRIGPIAGATGRGAQGARAAGAASRADSIASYFRRPAGAASDVRR